MSEKLARIAENERNQLDYYVRERGVPPLVVLNIYAIGLRRGAAWMASRVQAEMDDMHAQEAWEAATDKESAAVAAREACSPGCHCGDAAARVDREWREGPYCDPCMESDGYPQIRATERRQTYQDGEEAWVCQSHAEYFDRLAERKAAAKAKERPGTARPDWLDLPFLNP